MDGFLSPIVDDYRVTEEMLRDSGVTWTFLRNQISPDWVLDLIERAMSEGATTVHADDPAVAYVTRALARQPRRFGPPATRRGLTADPASPGRLFVRALEVQRNRRSDEILQRILVDLVGFMDVDGAPHIPIKAGVEHT